MDLTKNRFDSGVSPVVGVILMVAVTVILAAVIGTFVLDLGNNVQQNPQAGVTFDQTTSNHAGYNVSVQVVSITAADYLEVQYSGGGHINSNFANPTSVGDSAMVANASADDKVTVIGSLEGKQTVLQTYTVSDQS